MMTTPLFTPIVGGTGRFLEARDGLAMLTGRQPWWWAICHAGKRIENRRRILTKRATDILLHTSQKMTKADYAFGVASMRTALGITVPPMDDRALLPLGVVTGRARIVGLIAPLTSDDVIRAAFPDVDPRWHMKEQWGHVLEDVVVFSQTVPANGSLALMQAPREVREALGLS